MIAVSARSSATAWRTIGSSGHLERRGIGDINTMTVADFLGSGRCGVLAIVCIATRSCGARSRSDCRRGSGRWHPQRGPLGVTAFGLGVHTVHYPEVVLGMLIIILRFDRIPS